MGNIAERCVIKPGSLICGKYAVEKEIGEGSFGMVFKVQDRNRNQTCALKLFKFWEMSPMERESMFARFQMEFETGQIKSKYLASSIEHGRIKGNPFIVMEFYPNGDLRQFVGDRNADFVKIGKEVCYGLKDLHNCGKVHRDLKPENVLIKSDDTAVLTDFGISGDKRKRVTGVDLFGRPTFIAGTAIYMAPEQVKPKNNEVTVLPTMDIFAFGVMMYHLITAGFPFGELKNQDDFVIYLKNAREGNWNRNLLSTHPEGEKFDPVIAGCLEPDFKRRLQTADAVLSRLPQNAGSSYKKSGATFQETVVHGVLLRTMQGEDHGTVYKLNDLVAGKSRVITIGRKDVSINNILPITENCSSYISRKHCTLELSAGNQWFIRDGQWDRNAINGWNNSVNGTFINSAEAPQTGMPIQPGDIITIGDAKLRVEGY